MKNNLGTGNTLVTNHEELSEEERDAIEARKWDKADFEHQRKMEEQCQKKR